MPRDLDDDLIVSLMRAAFACRHAVQERLAAAGATATVAELGLLDLLSRSKGGRRVGEVAAFIRRDRTTITRVAAGLARKGLIERRTDPDDGRAIRLVPTALGRRTLKRLLPLREAVGRQAAAGLGRQRAQLIELLGTVRKNLSEDDA